jgi:TonB family protein
MIAKVRRLLACVGLIAIAMGAGVATAGAADGEARVVTKRVTPAYPDLARKVRATGKVKLTVLVTSEGKVKRVDVIGGHPLLVVAASDAAKQWLFAAASKESSELVVFEFSAPE